MAETKDEGNGDMPKTDPNALKKIQDRIKLGKKENKKRQVYKKPDKKGKK